MALPLAVGRIINRFNVGPLQMTRHPGRVKNERGAYEPVTPFVFEVNPVAAHTVDGRQLLQVPEADRNSEIVEFYARTSSFPAGQEARFLVADASSDVFLYLDRSYRFVGNHNYTPQGGVLIGFAALVDVQF
jgi:hypothetical protein